MYWTDLSQSERNNKLFSYLTEKPYTQTVLSFPNVNLASEQDDQGRQALLYGIPGRPYVRELRGAGRVLGVKFRTGGFYPYWRQDISLLTGVTVAASKVFGFEAEEWKNTILNGGDDAAMARQAEIALLTRLPERDTESLTLNQFRCF